jgi:hypothetical protein
MGKCLHIFLFDFFWVCVNYVDVLFLSYLIEDVSFKSHLCPIVVACTVVGQYSNYYTCISVILSLGPLYHEGIHFCIVMAII